MQVHWDDRWDGSRPNECNASHGVTDYNFTDLKRAIEMNACCLLQSPIRDISATVRVYRHSYGERGCGTGEVLLHVQNHTVELSDYDVDCPGIRQRLCP